uniref:Proton_antipo_M domain-containing protein n=1 Tax=Ascaris lumbricoides TaxID=6252 RepID=A0A0M3IQ61_ASCLU
MQSTTDDHAHFRDSVFNASHKHAMLESPPAYKEYSSHISLNNNQLFASFTYMTLIATRTFLFGIDGLHSVHNLNQRFFCDSLAIITFRMGQSLLLPSFPAIIAITDRPRFFFITIYAFIEKEAETS